MISQRNPRKIQTQPTCSFEAHVNFVFRGYLTSQVAAYLMSALAGKESPSAADIKKILASVEAECDDDLAKNLCEELKGKTIHEVIAEGKEKLKKFAWLLFVPWENEVGTFFEI